MQNTELSLGLHRWIRAYSAGKDFFLDES